MQEKEEMICVQCKKNIQLNDEYSKIKDFKDGKYIKKWYIHKVCFFQMVRLSRGFGGVMDNLNKITEKLLQ